MLREELSNTLKSAMLAHDSQTVAAVRLIIAGQKEKDVEARGKGNQQATDAELLSMMQSMIKQRKESIELYEKGGRADLVAKEKAEIDIITTFLPEQMDDEAIKNAINAVIAQDAVPVVRCKDCRFCRFDDTVYRKTIDGEENEPAYICGHNWRYCQEVKASHFCSYGERKGDGDD